MPAILIRFGTYGAVSLIAGIPLFLSLSLGRRQAIAAFARWRAPYALSVLAGALFSLLGLIAATAAMTGEPLLPVDWEMIAVVLSVTASAKAMLLRAGLCAVLFLLLLLPGAGERRFPPMMLLALAAAATLAWSGHAAAGEGAGGWLHLAGDIAHCLAAALWIGGMACLLRALRDPLDQRSGAMLGAFSWIGALVVGLLTATGILNLLLTVGTEGLLASLRAPYGQLLLAKIALFLAMLGLAANNRFRLTPAFDARVPGAASRLHRSVGVEITLGFVILALVAALGMIDPLGME